MVRFRSDKIKFHHELCEPRGNLLNAGGQAGIVIFTSKKDEYDLLWKLECWFPLVGISGLQAIFVEDCVFLGRIPRNSYPDPWLVHSLTE